LNWKDHVETDSGLLRPSDIISSCGNPIKANKAIDWKAECPFENLIERLVKAEFDT